jgi:hypothetical protein
VGLGAAFQFADRPVHGESLHHLRCALPTTAKAEEVAVSGKVSWADCEKADCLNKENR